MIHFFHPRYMDIACGGKGDMTGDNSFSSNIAMVECEACLSKEAPQLQKLVAEATALRERLERGSKPQ